MSQQHTIKFSLYSHRERKMANTVAHSGIKLTIFNAVASGAVTADRNHLANALWTARRCGRQFQRLCCWHATSIGWPVRKRPDGRWL